MMSGSELVNQALSVGFTNAAWLDDLKLRCEAKLRELCNPEGCPNHGNNWVCPPGCGSLEECAEKVSKFDKGILLQSASKLGSNSTDEDYKTLSRQHNLRLQAFLEVHCSGFGDILALTSGGCIFCEACAFPKPCVKPNIRMNSLSAYGIDVGRLCEVAGMDYSFVPDRVYFVALVLMK